MSKWFKTTKDGVKFQGKGTHGTPFRIYLYESQTPYKISVDDIKEDCNVLTYSKAQVGKVLYYRLKDTQELTVSNLKVGRFRLL